MRHGRRGECPLGSLTRRAETSHCAGTGSKVFLEFALKFCHEVVHHFVVEVFPTKMSVPRRSFHLKDTFLDGEKRHIKSTAPKIENEHPFLFAFSVKAVCNCCSGGLIDDAETI